MFWICGFALGVLFGYVFVDVGLGLCVGGYLFTCVCFVYRLVTGLFDLLVGFVRVLFGGCCLFVVLGMSGLFVIVCVCLINFVNCLIVFDFYLCL